MRALVTGGAGFIGSHLVDRLVKLGHDVAILDNFSTGSLANLDGFSGKIYRLPLSASLEVLTDFRPEVVYHLAAQMDVRKSVADSVADANTNVLGTIHLLEACVSTQVAKIVFTSSGGCIYGPPDATPVDETFSTEPHSPYGAAKVCAEVYIEMFHRLAALDFTVLALANVYGPRQNPHGEAGVVSIFAKRLMDGDICTIFGDGTSSRDYIFIDDVIDALILSYSKGKPRRLNVGTGISTSIDLLYREVAHSLGSSQPPVYASPRPGELTAITLDSTLAREQLGWQARWSLEDGLRATLSWLQESYGRENNS